MPPGGPETDFLGAQFGLMSNLRTGNIILDTAVCMIIPLLFGVLLRMFDQVKMWWDVSGSQWTRGSEYRRVIEYEKVMTSWGTEVPAPNCFNHLLQKSVTLYIAKHLSEKRLKVQRGSVSLLTVEHKPGQYYYNEDNGDGSSPADQLNKYRMTCEPAASVWSEVEPGLFFERSELINDDQSRGNNGNLRRSTIYFTFRCSKPNGDEVIQAFLDKAYAYYQDELRHQQDSSRYFYNMISTPAGGGGGDGGDPANGGSMHRLYKRYKLSDEKTFNSLFFPEKEQLLRLLKHFQDKSGKYRIEGYPHKLGLLLHGPPGTGKTSLIKAMAAHTKRHIVSIPLSRIKTNQELMDLVFDQVFHVAGEDLPQRLKFKSVIFVMEDVDAASSIVHARKSAAPPLAATTTVTITRETSFGQPDNGHMAGANDGGIHRSVSGAGTSVATFSPGMKGSSLSRQTSESLALPSANSIGSISMTGSGGNTSTYKVKKEIVLATDTASTTTHNILPPPVPVTIGQGSSIAEQQGEQEGEEDGGSDDGEVQGPEMDLSAALAGADREDAELIKTLVKGESKEKKEKSAFGKDDKLDLAGLLNVLDGVIDCPGRIVIMTSNHPEKLDEALIRPGRIDKKILLDYAKDQQAIDMIQHYFQRKLTEAEVSHVKEIFELKPKLTPAVLEQLCAEWEEIKDFLVALEKEARKKVMAHVPYK